MISVDIDFIWQGQWFNTYCKWISQRSNDIDVSWTKGMHLKNNQMKF